MKTCYFRVGDPTRASADYCDASHRIAGACPVFLIGVQTGELVRNPMWPNSRAQHTRLGTKCDMIFEPHTSCGIFAFRLPTQEAGSQVHGSPVSLSVSGTPLRASMILTSIRHSQRCIWSLAAHPNFVWVWRHWSWSPVVSSSSTPASRIHSWPAHRITCTLFSTSRLNNCALASTRSRWTGRSLACSSQPGGQDAARLGVKGVGARVP